MTRGTSLAVPRENGGDATARVAVGKRTLIIEPTKVSNGEVVTFD